MARYDKDLQMPSQSVELSSELTHPNFYARETSQVDVHKHLEFATRPGPNNGTL